MENYSITGRIGEGAHGHVLKGLEVKTGQEVALKKVLLKKIEEGISNSIIREIKSLLEVDCKYVSDIFAKTTVSSSFECYLNNFLEIERRTSINY